MRKPHSKLVMVYLLEHVCIDEPPIWILFSSAIVYILSYWHIPLFPEVTDKRVKFGVKYASQYSTMSVGFIQLQSQTA